MSVLSWKKLHELSNDKHVLAVNDKSIMIDNRTFSVFETSNRDPMLLYDWK